MMKRETIHALVDYLPDEELETAGKFLEFLASRNEPEEIDDPESVRMAQEALSDPVRYALDSVLKEAGI